MSPICQLASRLEMKCNNISRIQYHSVIRSPKTKTTIIQHNGKKMGFTSSESVTSEDTGGFKSTQLHLNSKAKEMRNVDVEKLGAPSARPTRPSMRGTSPGRGVSKRAAPKPTSGSADAVRSRRTDAERSHGRGVVFRAPVGRRRQRIGRPGRGPSANGGLELRLYSSALVECEDHDSYNDGRHFDVLSVKKEINRGRKLKCTFCGERGATVGCDLRSCAKNYHFFCAKSDRAALQTDESQGIYKVFCQQHADTQNDLLSVKPLSGVFHPHCSQRTKPRHGVKRRGKKRASTGNHIQPLERMTLNRFVKQMKEKDGRPTDAIVKATFLKKCKEAGLLNTLFEEILDKLHSIQGRLMDETTSESGTEITKFVQRDFSQTYMRNNPPPTTPQNNYEEIGTSLFDCRLFEDTLVNLQAAIENKIHQSEEQQRQLKEEIELLQDLKQTLCSDLQSSSTSDSSLSS
ncbi:PHD finger protein 11 [Camelus dromedarius]|uniref:PHD finger protein 11 n=1 Tax=Camelus dromedarius TaxID=9838 RepID=A0A5N4D924_CAMDR|nr:PHD finger protein 11 [Camelus dromedarius]